MKTTNEIEKKITEKAQKELKDLVLEFVNKLEKYESDGYGSFKLHHTKINKSSEEGFLEISISKNPTETIKHHLESILRESFLPRLVKNKTTELINKLDLF